LKNKAFLSHPLCAKSSCFWTKPALYSEGAAGREAAVKDAAKHVIDLLNDAIRDIKQTDFMAIFMAMDDEEIRACLEEIDELVEALRRKLHPN
jgi:hypothetical protein